MLFSNYILEMLIAFGVGTAKPKSHQRRIFDLSNMLGQEGSQHWEDWRTAYRTTPYQTGIKSENVPRVVLHWCFATKTNKKQKANASSEPTTHLFAFLLGAKIDGNCYKAETHRNSRRIGPFVCRNNTKRRTFCNRQEFSLKHFSKTGQTNHTNQTILIRY